ncbi:MAG: DUF5060 domain-containing protein [Candidatus Glassbacteria bacterium]|nr:DUF5060 domain-containing protein [Candidatus Glassbacteria bacterium]
MTRILTYAVLLAALTLSFSCGKEAFELDLPRTGEVRVPLYGLFETSVTNKSRYSNPFSDVTLNASFTSPSGRVVRFWGFYDGINLWRQRFMPDELGTWFYSLNFSDGWPGEVGSFECVEKGSLPGPWKQDPDNPRWLTDSHGEHFLPLAVFADCHLTPTDWRDMIAWCEARGYNTLVVPNFNTTVWGDGWGNRTAWATKPSEKAEFVKEDLHKIVNYQRFNLPMWREWDEMIRTAAAAGIYLGSFEGPCGKFGGQEKGKYPPDELVFEPRIHDRFDSETNISLMRYFLARQAAFWNVAYWSLGNTEVFDYCVDDKQEFLEYGRFFASLTPFGRMITAQDCEQWHNEDRRWLSELDIPDSRKLNTVQTAVGNYSNPEWQKASLNNALALDTWASPPESGGFPVIVTEGLWEGQARAEKPLKIIWSFYAAGAHTVWADWRYENNDHTYGSIGRSWAPAKPLERHLFGLRQLGADCVGDEQLALAAEHIKRYEYWKMEPHNELVQGGGEAYCLAEPGRQYMVYAPAGGKISLDLSEATGKLSARWFDPRDGSYGEPFTVSGGGVGTFTAPGAEDWVLSIGAGQ